MATSFTYIHVLRGTFLKTTKDEPRNKVMVLVLVRCLRRFLRGSTFLVFLGGHGGGQ